MAEYVDPFDALLAEQQSNEKQGQYIDPFDKAIQEQEAIQPILGIDPVGALYEAGKGLYNLLPSEEAKNRPLTERAQAIGTASGIGATLGALGPKALEYGGRGIQNIPGLKLPGRVAEEFGKSLQKSNVLPRTIYGAAGAGGGEAVGQVVTEATGKPALGFAADVATGGLITPVIRTGEIAWGFAGRAARSLAKAGDVTNETDNLVKEIAKLRGGSESYLPASTVTSALEKGAKQFEISNLTKLDSEISTIKNKLENVTNDSVKSYMTIGKPLEKSEVGDLIRGNISSKYTKMLEDRTNNYKKDLATRNEVVEGLQSSGKFVNDLPEYKSLQKELESKLLIGTGALQSSTKNVADPAVKRAYADLYTALKESRTEISKSQFQNLSEKGLRVEKTAIPKGASSTSSYLLQSPMQEGGKFYRVYPNSFEALDDVRRKLGDAAFGKDTEGYAALGQNIAKDLYGKVSNIQLQFAGEPHRILQGNYEEASGLLAPFKSLRGNKVTAVDRINPEAFTEDVANLPNKFFSSRQGATDLIELSGDYKKAEDIARSHIAREIKEMDSTQLSNYLNNKTTTDWLSKFPNIVKDLGNFKGKLTQSDLLAESLAKKADILDKEKDTISKLALGIKGEDLRPAKRVEALLRNTKDPKVLTEVSRIINTNPLAKEAFPKAIRQYVANSAGKETKQLWEGELAPLLSKTGLLSPAEIQSISSDVTKLTNAYTNKSERAHLISILLFNALNTAIATAPTRLNEYNEFYKSKPMPVNTMGL